MAASSIDARGLLSIGIRKRKLDPFEEEAELTDGRKPGSRVNNRGPVFSSGEGYDTKWRVLKK